MRIRICMSIPLITGSRIQLWIRLHFPVTLRMPKKQLFFIVFSHNLPSGILSSVLKIKFCVKNLFCKHYFSPLNTFYKKREGSGSRSGAGSILLTNGSGSKRPKKCGSGSGSPTLQTRKPFGVRISVPSSMVPKKSRSSVHTQQKIKWRKICVRTSLVCCSELSDVSPDGWSERPHATQDGGCHSLESPHQQGVPGGCGVINVFSRFGPSVSVLRVHDILGWIRIRIWILLFSSLTFKMLAKN